MHEGLLGVRTRGQPGKRTIRKAGVGSGDVDDAWAGKLGSTEFVVHPTCQTPLRRWPERLVRASRIFWVGNLWAGTKCHGRCLMHVTREVFAKHAPDCVGSCVPAKAGSAPQRIKDMHFGCISAGATGVGPEHDDLRSRRCTGIAVNGDAVVMRAPLVALFASV